MLLLILDAVCFCFGIGTYKRGSIPNVPFEGASAAACICGLREAQRAELFMFMYNYQLSIIGCQLKKRTLEPRKRKPRTTPTTGRTTKRDKTQADVICRSSPCVEVLTHSRSAITRKGLSDPVWKRRRWPSESAAAVEPRRPAAADARALGHLPMPFGRAPLTSP